MIGGEGVGLQVWTRLVLWDTYNNVVNHNRKLKYMNIFSVSNITFIFILNRGRKNNNYYLRQGGYKITRVYVFINSFI